MDFKERIQEQFRATRARLQSALKTAGEFTRTLRLPSTEGVKKIATGLFKKPDLKGFSQKVANAGTGLTQKIRDPKAILGGLQGRFQGKGLVFYGKAATLVICAYFLSDIIAMGLGRFIPTTNPRLVRNVGPNFTPPVFEDYNVIISRNLFNSSGYIPGEKAPNPDQGPAIRTSLPLTLVGTMILRDERRSIATIEDKGASMVYPVRVDDEIPGKIRVLKVEARKLTFINVSSGRKEFVDLPEEPAVIQTTIRSAAPVPVKKDGIEKISETQLNVDSVAIDSAMKDFNNLMTQARAIPHFENGMPAGYKIIQIVKGSFFDKIGIQNEDVIKAANGEPITDPGQALNMLNKTKTSDRIEITVMRGGQEKVIQYNIRR